jgi:prepilin-type N-terminal cleavage/methylation domain-containing protein
MRRGVTLLEMIVVLVILAILLALVVPIFQRPGGDLGVRASADAVAGLLRQASAHARVESTPLWVEVEANDHRARSVTRRVLGNWRFETGPRGPAADAGWTCTGGRPAPGRLGMGIYLNRSGVVSVGRVGPLDPAQGFFLEVWVQRKQQYVGGSSRQRIVGIGADDGLEIDAQGKPRLRLGGLTLAGTRLIPASPESWTHVMVVYDPAGELRLYLDRAPCGAVKGMANLPAWIEPSLGARQGGFDGVVDEFVVGQLVGREHVSIPSEARLTQADGSALPDARLRIHFGPDGALDPAHHPGPVRLLFSTDALKTTITVQPNGTVTRD